MYFFAGVVAVAVHHGVDHGLANRNAHAVEVIFVQPQRLRLPEDDLFRAIYAFQCGFQLPFLGCASIPSSSA